MKNPLIAVFTDPHFGNKGHDIIMFEQQMKFFETQFFPYVKEKNIKFVLCCGDFYHDRNKVDWYIQNELKKRFFQWFDDNGVELHALVGNHDTYYKTSLTQNSLSETTKFFKNVHAYTKPSKIKVGKYTIGLNPWIIDVKNPKLTEKVDILLGHFDIVGFPMMKGIHSKEGLNQSQLSAHKLVLSGHYHTRAIRDNIHMIGIPFQLNWNDHNEDKGFLILDNNFNWEYIRNEVNPKYVKIYYTNGKIEVLGLDYTEIPKSISKEESLTIAKKNYCKLFTKAVDDQMALETYHSSLLQISLDDYKIDIISLQDVVESFDDTSFDEAFESGESTIQLITSCIDNMTFESGIDKNLLIELSKTEYKNAHQEALSLGED